MKTQNEVITKYIGLTKHLQKVNSVSLTYEQFNEIRGAIKTLEWLGNSEKKDIGIMDL